MVTVILVAHILIALALVGVILLQRSEGGALGIGGGGGGGGAGGGMMSSRGAANLLTRATGILAACFIATSITLAILSGGSEGPSSVIETTAPQSPVSGAPTQERSGPSVPLSQ
jgi:preprotein translocase subunit SecG